MKLATVNENGWFTTTSSKLRSPSRLLVGQVYPLADGFSLIRGPSGMFTLKATLWFGLEVQFYRHVRRLPRLSGREKTRIEYIFWRGPARFDTLREALSHAVEELYVREAALRLGAR
jgi:hypothetical protein